MTVYIDRDRTQYKANLHSHSTSSDGKLTVDELIKAYKDKGYSILAITDHETPVRHSRRSTEDFLLLDGYEAYIRPSSKCIYNKFKPEIHLNLIARSEINSNDKIPSEYMPYIGYNFFYTKYFDKKIAKSLDVARKLKTRYFSKWYINTFIETANKNGYFVFLNHPYWSMMDVEMVNSLEGIHSMEIYNTSSMRINNDEGDIKYYDMYLRKEPRSLFRRKKNDTILFCHGSDDNHNPGKGYSDSFGAFTYILADKLDYKTISDSIQNGDFYASTGPQIKYLEINGKTARIETDDCETISLHVTPKFSLRMDAPSGMTINHAEFKIPVNSGSVYLRIKNKEGKTAVTRAFKV